MSTTSQQAESQDHDQRYAVHPGSGNLHELRLPHSLLQIGTDGPPTCFCGNKPSPERGWNGIATDPDELDYDGRATGCVNMRGDSR